MLTLIFGIWASEPPWAWRTTEKAGPDRVKILETEYENHFEFIVILCPTINKSKTYLSKRWIFDDNNVFIKCDVNGLLNEWIKLFENALKGYQTLFIIDDCSAEGEVNKKRDALSELAFSSRHRNHSLWVLTQKYNSISKDIREQIKWLCFFFTKDQDSFKDCLRMTSFLKKTEGID